MRKLHNSRPQNFGVGDMVIIAAAKPKKQVDVAYKVIDLS